MKYNFLDWGLIRGWGLLIDHLWYVKTITSKMGIYLCRNNKYAVYEAERQAKGFIQVVIFLRYVACFWKNVEWVDKLKVKL